ncbi:MAG: hypothetical protein A2096_06375 [Spirochaetes bacterium GWF1_41_5]|nr:MAG: hypothetical protein A2096_06375 [Spirochaetes bacterium GWF1_41_5]
MQLGAVFENGLQDVNLQGIANAVAINNNAADIFSIDVLGKYFSYGTNASVLICFFACSTADNRLSECVVFDYYLFGLNILF